MNDTTEIKRCYPSQNEFVGHEIKVEIIYRVWHNRFKETEEDKYKHAASVVSDLNSLLKEHREAPPIRVYVEPIRGTVCSNCRRVWEAVEEGGKTYCANCGAIAEDKV